MQFCSFNLRNAEGRSTALRFSARAFAAVLVWSIAVGSFFLPASLANTALDSDTVYCPLQKRFVERSQPAAIVSLSTKEYCASPRETEEFSLKLIQNVGFRSILDQDEVDSLFFAYKVNSEHAFRGLTGSHNDPKTPSATDQSKQAVTSSASQITPALLASEYLEADSLVSLVRISKYYVGVDAHSSTAHYISDPQRGPPTN